ncbi:hypothetical protein A3K29_05780 [Candidatus Collierbacteria bacterium RIFOXYB2_FULL_46_14]|uniref:Uncharacterized protein n=1 Tax=Candidatus Collierbacteria bacterium GW2011_GWA2_46_26 TaxID=1618381 RepID=A0A0G1PIL9_9BACT|nr:MAG: hypothetical protein UX47_C0009G0004 [Candidatus Collierbacteria bacterium GW2011_GWA2_46_26]OGD73599.1 MAG: hypothetical protein A3K29_05780 [Candidatus Collierbacteria bacterium RIFOXYB2_FULL_46_14]OGD76641.1 MAG: hypothetical protein A3K43_05780 [Candidatus Collierbacteria bacterium RIFOXYA2_FULL_46_20]OGD77977.1 MAG: hypothetical protein A3K39_05780 [Candidatus Collierbacteria bacterium RIFOXYC2_FULL_43_15]OGD80001.1 MAG: hypothetical protein A2320_00210 [Pseudomonadales bacterium G
MGIIFWIVLVVWIVVLLGLLAWVWFADRKVLPIIVLALFLLASAVVGYLNFPSTTAADCVSDTLVTEPKVDQIVYDDLSDGDPTTWTVTIVNPAKASLSLRHTVVIVSEAGHSVDVVYSKMIFSSYRLSGTREEVLCFIEAILGDNKVGFKIWNNDTTDIPRGWTTVVETKGWWDEMTTWNYGDEAHIDSGKPVEGFCEPTKSCVILPAKDHLIHGQLWLAGHEGYAVHFQVEGGYRMTAPIGWQGSTWDYATLLDSLQETIMQASRFAVERDHILDVVEYFCGDPSHLPGTVLDASYLNDDGHTVTIHATWHTTSVGFTCEKVSP